MFVEAIMRAFFAFDETENFLFIKNKINSTNLSLKLKRSLIKKKNNTFICKRNAKRILNKKLIKRSSL